MKICALLIATIAALCAQAPAIPPETVVANIDGKPVTAADVQRILANTPGIAAPYQRNPTLTLEEYFMTQYIAAEGEKLHLADESPWKEQLAALRSQLLTNAMVNRERDAYPVSVEMMDEHYKRNQEKYQQTKIKVIFIAFNPAPPTGTSPEAVKEAARVAVENARHPERKSEPDARKLAADLVKQIREGADFAKLVAQYSEDEGSKKEGGDFGTVTPTSSFPEDFKKSVLALKQGEVSDPVRQPTGFYIIRAEERSAVPIDKVREAMIQEIRQDHLRDYIEGLRKRFAPKVEKPDFFQPPAAAPTPAAAAK